MAAICREGKIFWKLPRVHFLDSLWVENFDEITLSHTVKEIEAILCFAFLGKNSKIQNGHHMWKEENFWKLPRVHSSDTLWVENFDEIPLSHMVKEIEAILCFVIFGKNSKIQNGCHIWGGENFWKLPRVHCSDTLLLDNFDEIALSHTVKEIEAILCFAFLGKNSKIQNGHHMWKEENFWKLPRVHSSDTLWVENFDEIPLSHMVKEIEAILCFVIFGKNSKIQNGCHIWGGENFWKLPRVHCSDTLLLDNFDEIALSRTVKEIEANSCFAIFGKNSKIQNGRHFWGGEM